MLKLKTIKSKCEINLSMALDKYVKEGWKVARNHYTKDINGQRYYYIDIVKEEIDEESNNE